MNTTHPQLALREWRQHMGQPVTLVALLGTGVMLTLVAPFDTAELLPALPRWAYWTGVTLAGYGWGSLVATVLSPLRPALLRWGLSGLVTGMGLILMLLAVNGLVFGWLPDRQELPGFLGLVMAISMVTSAVMGFATDQQPQQPPHARADSVPVAPPLLDRLPLEKRAALVALSVEDHYVRVRTTKGEEMLLMRLSDAIREVGSTKGAQVHRSHWVAFDQVIAARRQGDRALLQMSHGPEIPVSRANLPVIKEAGLLPR